MRPFNPITRRAVMAGAGLAATLAILGTPARSQGDGFRVIRAREGQARLSGPGRELVATWDYDGTVPGPVLRIRRGDELKVRLVNALAADTSIHWHGVRVPNGMDGTALTQMPVAPGASFDYRFTPPDAGTFWYHPPLRTRQNRALQGLLIVDEPQAVDADRDVALVIDAWDGQFSANGLAALDIPVATNERMRLRLINAAERLITVHLDRHPMTVMAIDGQPAEPFMPRENRITLSPGSRADLFVDCVLEPGSIASVVLQIDTADVPLARLVYDDHAPLRPSPRSQAKPLPDNPLPDRMDFRGALRAELALNADARGLSAAPLFSAKRRRTVMLALANRSAAPHVAHIHGHHVRLLDALDDGWKPFWLDTILCLPQYTTRVAFVADNPGKWLLQARAIGSEASQTAWFEVT
jgi:FtsP/CotA-like multicopper oxidase with cupredoxin domain